MNRYTHAPTLNRNILIGCLQLFHWVLLHPSAWRNHIAQIAPELNADFTLTQLQVQRRAQHQTQTLNNPALRRLLVQAYLIWPLVVGVVLAIVLTLMGKPPVNIVFGSLFGLSLGLVTGVIIGLVMSVAGGLAAVVIAGLSIGLASGVGGFVLAIGQGEVMIGAGNIYSASTINGVVSYVAIGMVGAVAASIPDGSARYNFARRVGGIVAGVILGAIVVSLSIPFARTNADLLARGGESALLSGLYSGVTVGAIFALTILIASNRLWISLGWGVTLALMVGVLRIILYGVMLGNMGLAEIGLNDLGLNDAVRRVSEADLNVRNGLTGIMLGPLFSAIFGTAVMLPFALIKRFAGPWVSVIAGTVGGGGAFVAFSEPISIGSGQLVAGSLICIGIGLTYQVWLPVLLYPFQLIWNNFLLRWDLQRVENRSLSTGAGGTIQPKLHRHSVFWDERQRWPMPSLEEHLLLTLGADRADGDAAMSFLSTSNQKRIAQAAQIEMDARQLADCTNVDDIAQVTLDLSAGELEGPASSLLRTFSRIGEDLDAALRQESAYNQRLALGAVEDRLDGLLRELTRSSEPYAERFRPIATDWRAIVADKSQELATTAELRQEIDSPYIIGVPLTAQQEIFVGRTDISSRIEGLILNAQHPPLMLYGQRRMGKTSLLNNLGRLLPSTIVPMFVDMQGPASLAEDHAGLFYNLARGMRTSARRQRNLMLPKLDRAEMQDEPFTVFDEWLDEVEDVLGDQQALLALDEIEALDEAISSGRFDADAVLGTLRHVIQHRAKFKLLLTSSHTLDELRHWAGYLVNVQTLHVGYLSEAETTQLVERPVPEFALRYEADATARVLDLTRGHPALTQLLCYEVVTLKNEGPAETRRLATVADVNAAIPNALESGSFFFTEMANQVGAAGQSVLRQMADAGEGEAFAIDLRDETGEIDATVDLLCRRDLIEERDGRYRFQVELFRHWFRQ